MRYMTAERHGNDMGVMDKFLNYMKLNGEDDEYYDEDYLDEDEEIEPARSQRKAPAAKPKEPEEDFEERPVKKTPAANKITPIGKPTTRRTSGGAGMEVCVIKPSAIEDELEITDTLLNGRTVVINMEGLNVEIAQRIIDFTSGATYAMRGNLQKISNYIFLATPNGVDISGDIQNLMESFDIPGFTV